MSTETSVTNLKINKLTSAQYNTITPSSTELYMVTDDNSYQEKLVSGTNIKTINNESLLGSGNITIQGGGTSTLSGLSDVTITSATTGEVLGYNGTKWVNTNKTLVTFRKWS